MKAVVFHGPRQAAVEGVTNPKIEEPLDAIIKITTTNICGSDLHPYDGRAPLDEGMVLGHENMGIVAETGPGVNRSRSGTGSRCRSTWPAGPAGTATRAGPRRACGPTRPASPARATAIRTWAR